MWEIQISEFKRANYFLLFFLGVGNFKGLILGKIFFLPNLLKILWFYGSFSFHNKINRGRQSFGVQFLFKKTGLLRYSLHIIISSSLTSCPVNFDKHVHCVIITSIKIKATATTPIKFLTDIIVLKSPLVNVS